MNSSISVAFLDVDGVLANFVAGALRAHNTTLEAFLPKWPVATWDMAQALGVDDTGFWRAIDLWGPHFWENLEFMPDALEILDVVERHFPKVVLMTAPSMSSSATAGKVAWIKNHLPKYATKFAITQYKDAFAHPGAVLIDDYDKNIEKFRAAGGKAVMVPRRWNSAHQLANVSASALAGELLWVKEPAK